ncbi:hypothetical protein J7I94_35725 [Streptomyces sp. ISL-12]|uniref:hypothetical protein n=1 Tax=Streptomyces sp. ISL-12 TaxID=2819177 RepID=UPI001BEA286B|nr:hypothetical protein [Streptomyces sp. ISL-12]MBT2415815.1 hypothetical protein [Streptomyces sp. ISL-12]
MTGSARTVAGQWDAVRVPRQLGLAALGILGARAGAVVDDPSRASLIFFVPAGTAAAWDVENTEALADAVSVPLPPIRRTAGPGPHWRTRPGTSGWLTDPRALADAIDAAFGSPVGRIT